MNNQQLSGFFEPLSQVEALISASKARLQTLRIPDVDINTSISSANPNEWVTAGRAYTPPITDPIPQVFAEQQRLTNSISQQVAIRSRVIGHIHNFAVATYSGRAFSGLAESIFETYRGRVDTMLAQRAGEALQKIPSLNARLAEGDSEAISAALNTCRRIIDSFADAVQPPSEGTVTLGRKEVEAGADRTLSRLKAYIERHSASATRASKLKRTLQDLRGRVSAGVHSDVTPGEARALFLETYLLLGEVLDLAPPPLLRDDRNAPSTDPNQDTLAGGTLQ